MAGLNFNINADNTQFLRKISEVKKGVEDMASSIEKEGMSIDALFSRITRSAAALGAGFTAKEFISQVVNVRGEMQKLEVAFTTMLGSKADADALMSQLIQTAATTPFGMSDVANGAKQLLAYGTAAEEVNETLVRLGDIAAGLSIPLGDLVYLYGTTMTQGQMFTQDLRQFMGRGVPIAEELAKQFGVAKSEVARLVTAGKVGAEEFKKALWSMTDEGSKFGGLMAAQSATIAGQIANIEDAIEQMFNEIGKSSEGVINEALSGVSYLIEHYRQIGEAVSAVVAAYGLYKAAVMSVAAYQSAATSVRYSAEMAELSALVPLKEKEAATELQQAVASGRLTAARAAEVSAMRAEAEAQVQLLAQKAAEAKLNYQNATAAAANAALELEAAEMSIAAANETYAAAMRSGDARRIENAEMEIGIAQSNRMIAARQLEAARMNVTTASEQAATAARAAETAQTTLNTSAMAANARATNVLTVAKTKLIEAARALGLTMLANPYVIAAAAVTALGYSIYKLITYQTEQEKSAERMNKAIAGVESSVSSEMSALSELNRKLAESVKGSDEWKKAKERIVKGYSQYLSGIDAEIEATGNLAGKYNELEAAIRKAAAARSFARVQEQEDEKYQEVREKNMEKAYNYFIKEYGQDEGLQYYREWLSWADREDDTPERIQEIYSNRKVDLNTLLQGIRNQDKIRKETLDKYKDIYNLTDEDIATPEEGGTPEPSPETKNKAYWEKKKKDAEAARDALDEQQKNSEEWNEYTRQIQEAESHLSSWSTPASKGRTDSEKEAERQKQLQQKLNDELLKLREENQDAETSLMEEGTEKKLRQIKTEYGRQKDAIAKQESEWAKANREAGVTGLNEGGLTQEQQTALDEARRLNELSRKQAVEGVKAEEAEKLKAHQEAWDEYYKRFGDYQQKRQAIAASYAEKIAEAEKEGDSGKAASLTREMENELDGLDNAVKGSATLMGQLFADASKMSVSEIQKIIDKAEQLLAYLGAAKDEKGTADIGGEKVSRQSVLDLGISETSLRNLELSADEVESLRQAIDRLRGELTGKSPFKKFEKEVEDAFAKFRNGDIEGGISDIGKAVTEFSPALSQFGDSLGTIFGSDGLGSAVSGISDALGGLGQTASGVGQIMSGDIVGGAMSAVNGIASVVSAFEGLFGADYSEYEEMKGRYDTLVSLWDELIGRKTEYISIDYGTEAMKAAEEAARLTEMNIVRQRELAEKLAESGSSIGSHSLGYRVDVRMEDSDWRAVSDLVGQKVSSLGDVLALDADIIGGVLQNERFVTVLSEVNSEFIDYIQSISDYADRLDEIAEKEKEAFTGVSFDEFRDGFVDMLSDLSTENEDFAEDFEDALRNAVFSALVANQYKARIQALYDQWSDYSKSDGELTSDEAAKMREEYSAIVQDMMADRQSIMDAMGWSTEAQLQSASSGGFQSMSQDTSDELNGRFTALYECGLRIYESMQSLLSLTVSADARNALLTEIRNLMVSSNGYLEDIAGYQRRIWEKVNTRLDDINENIKAI